METKQAIGYQIDLFIEQKMNSILYSESREYVMGATAEKDCQVTGKRKQGRALAGNLLQAVCSGNNLQRAYAQVKKNKGVAGIDQVPIGSFPEWYSKEGEQLLLQLLRGEYEPEAVKEVVIPKPDGGGRKLGIPTVKDRVIQQAINQVLSSIYEPQFSDNSFGFRPNRNAHQTLKKASEYASEGYEIVVDVDLKNFFDEVNHDRLMHRLSKDIADTALLQLIRRYLRGGILTGGVISTRTTGTPQGSPLSPLLSNIVLDELDKELERRGHKFVRYADDCNIYVRSQEASNRVLSSLTNFIEGKLKLIVNKDKSKACPCDQTKFLGYTVQRNGTLTIAEKSKEKLKAKIRSLTRRNKGRSLAAIVAEINAMLRGWLNYFKLARCGHFLRNTDAWIRRKLRCYRLKQCKRTATMQKFLHSLGVANWQSWILALSGKGLWRKSGMPQSQQSMNLLWFEELGLYNLSVNYKLLND